MNSQPKIEVKYTKFFANSPYAECNRGETHVITLRIDRLNRLSHFSITCDVYEGKTLTDRSWVAGGCMHDVIEKYHPQFAPLVKWHLWDIEGSMHYVANALYALGWQGWHDNGKLPDLRQFNNHTNWGLLPEDQFNDFWITSSHALIENHKEGFAGDLYSYFKRNPHYAAYLRPYIAEYTQEITQVLTRRIPGLIDLMLKDLYPVFESLGVSSEEVHDALYTENTFNK